MMFCMTYNLFRNGVTELREWKRAKIRLKEREREREREREKQNRERVQKMRLKERKSLKESAEREKVF